MSNEFPWEQLGRQVAAEIADHPMVREFQVSVGVSRSGITASIEEDEQAIKVRVADRAWWEPATPFRAQVIANQLAVLLYEARIDRLRQLDREL